jgi:hypothetical protein
MTLILWPYFNLRSSQILLNQTSVMDYESNRGTYTDNMDFSYSSVHLNHQMFGLDSYQGHMRLNYKHVKDVCPRAFSDTL